MDVTLDLSSGSYKPYMKENDTPIYVNCGSNHPPVVLKNIPQGVNNRLNRISSSKSVFDSAAPVYQEALSKSGYTYKLEYKPKDQNCNIGRDFLKLIDSAFPASHPLYKLFTRQTVKMSYKCMPNMAKAVAQDNVRVSKNDPQQNPQQPG